MFQITIKITTPPGQATKAFNRFKTIIKLKILLIKRKYREIKTYISEDDSVIYWSIMCDIKYYINLHKRIDSWNMYKMMAFGNPLLDKQMRKRADSPEVYEEVKKLIFEGTTIEIVKGITAQNIIDSD